MNSLIMRYLMALNVAGLMLPADFAIAHRGGLAADGCHNNRKNGGRHCHRGDQTPARQQRAAGGSTAFANCSAARAAGAAPVRAGQPGYGRHLDRDGDGVGCE